MTWKTKIGLLLAAAALAGCLKAGDGLGLDATGQRLPFCQTHPDDPSCVVVVDPCIANPSLPQCDTDTCATVPPAPGCSVDVCTLNPSDPSCIPPTRFASVLPIIKANGCQQCHLPGGAGMLQGKLNLTDANAYAGLVNVLVADQTIAPGWVRVKPYVPDSSMLLIKVSKNPPRIPNGPVYFSMMPMGFPVLTAAAVDTIRKWILDGALQ